MDRILHLIKKIIPGPVFNLFAPAYHFFLSYLAAYYYKHPSRKLIVIGVVGTNGKTSVVEILGNILGEAGFKVASISSLYFTILGERQKNTLKMTMPGRFKLQKFLDESKNKGVTHVILEATSEGIKQFRHKNIAWDILIFTNLSPEHIESHGTIEEYKKTKEKIFADLSKTYKKPQIPKIIIVNADDKESGKILKYNADKKYVYGLEKEFSLGVADFITPSAYSLGEQGVGFTIEGEDFITKLLGKFNLYNILASIACARAFGVPWHVIKKSIGEIESIPGRMEFVQREPFSVVVDYAHTPDSLKKVYAFLKESISNFQEIISKQIPISNNQNPKLICLLGAAGGGRDKWKRPEMGKIAGEFCDEIILTNEDPYDENPESILNDIESGFSEIRNTNIEIRKILDRREAIREALRLAKQGDVVVITGKGAEPWMAVEHGKKIKWDDREVVREELKSLQN